MSRKTSAELQAELDEMLIQYGYRQRPKAKLEVVAERELSVETLRERHEREERRLMEAEVEESKRRAREHNQRLFHKLRAEQQRPPTPAEAYQMRLDQEWEANIERIEQHREALRRLGPAWYVGECHRD
jgi:hypothetical protein